MTETRQLAKPLRGNEKGRMKRGQEQEKGTGYLNLAGRPRGAQGGFEPQCGGELLLALRGAKGLLAVHTGAEGGEFVRHERLINRRCPLLG